ncbi:phosphonate C-P lyase system protein PhnG [Achromobacter xylosoxidans]|uniref:phosphonate C-P lyase system protein PhnG n=1 Tax=Alcaligenes xylosoxydans xylosoxydans TaxID=85698 RepID=UPI0012A823BE|nr:phosphonate C-P lyase system protein PhnG [Achromobacter xylosoxidans]CUR79934.1 Alpha-D-ribose 1-methylphosphonate 5-triphosphate synthase subunit PhnG [Achromobacter xylosoxidans]
MDHPQTAQGGIQAQRTAWMRVLALADPAMLEGAFGSLGGLPPHQMLRPAQTGMAMVRARSGGTGARFNLSEMTVTRCAVSLDNGVVGIAYVQGRSLRHAEQAAVADALLQLPDWHDTVQAQLIQPLARERAERIERQARVAAQTKVEFFTMVRGED